MTDPDPATHALDDYDTRATTLLARLDAHTHHTPRTKALSQRLINLIGSDSPRLISAVHEAEAVVERELLRKGGFSPTEARDPAGLWTASGGTKPGEKPKKAGNLKRGDGMVGKPNIRVRALQQLLKKAGIDLGKPGVDGRFGPITERAVRTLQARNNLKADGVVGPDTLDLLKRMANKKPKPKPAVQPGPSGQNQPGKPSKPKPRSPGARPFVSGG